MGYDDAEFIEHRDQITASGNRIGLYHYGWAIQDPIIEADHFLRVAKPRLGELVALDLERAKDGESWARRVYFALAWLGHVKAATGSVPLLYVNGSWARALWDAATPAQRVELLTYPLWYANPNGTPGVFTPPVVGWDVAMHQYSWSPLLYDRFNGGYEAWDRLAVVRAS